MESGRCQETQVGLLDGRVLPIALLERSVNLFLHYEPSDLGSCFHRPCLQS